MTVGSQADCVAKGSSSLAPIIKLASNNNDNNNNRVWLFVQGRITFRPKLPGWGALITLHRDEKRQQRSLQNLISWGMLLLCGRRIQYYYTNLINAAHTSSCCDQKPMKLKTQEPERIILYFTKKEPSRARRQLATLL